MSFQSCLRTLLLKLVQRITEKLKGKYIKFVHAQNYGYI